MAPMRKLLWLGVLGVICVIVVLATREKKEAAKAAPTRDSGGSARPVATATPDEPAGSATPAPTSAPTSAPAEGSAEEADTRPVPTCSEALANGLDTLAKADSPDAAELQAKLQTIYLRRCAEDKWPVAALRCFASTKGMSAMKLCRGMLSAEQAKKLSVEVRGAMTGETGGTDGAQPTIRNPGPVPVGGPPTAPTN